MRNILKKYSKMNFKLPRVGWIRSRPFQCHSLLGFALLFLVLFQPLSLYAGKKEIPIHSGRSLRQQVETTAEFSVKEMELARNNKERFRILKKIDHQISVLRENSPMASDQDETFMDLLVTVLKALPSEKEFNKKDCAKYEADLLNQFDPTAEDIPTIPAVKPGWSVLKLLCK